jgi:phytoene dehydrogenase-like protein
MEKLPRHEFALEYGYTMYSYTPKGDTGKVYSAVYAKKDLFLRLREDGTATLEKYLGLVKCMVPEFSFPNKNFKIFEDWLNSIHSSKL